MRILFVIGLVVCLASCAPPYFLYTDREHAEFKISENFNRPYQEMFHCFISTAPKAMVAFGELYSADRIYSDLGLAEFQVGRGDIYYTLIEFRHMADRQTQVTIWSQYGPQDARYFLGIRYIDYVRTCGKP